MSAVTRALQSDHLYRALITFKLVVKLFMQLLLVYSKTYQR